MSGVPAIRQVVFDCLDTRGLAEFYRQLCDLRYRPGDAPSPDEGAGEVDPPDWLCLRDRDGRSLLAFQQVDDLPRVTWPEGEIPQQLHLDLTVPSMAELLAADERVLALGGSMLYDRIDDPEEPLRVYTDPEGHPFCIFVADEEAYAAWERQRTPEQAGDDVAGAR